MNQRDFLSAKEAAEALGVKLPTLYAYVSRGFLRSAPGENPTGPRQYSRQDVEALRQRQDLKRRPREAAESALSWGVPLLPSALTLIDEGRLYYRGVDAIELSQTASLESVASLLWDCGSFPAVDPMPLRAPEIEPVSAFSSLLPLLAEADLDAYDPRPEIAVRTAARILTAFVQVAAGEGDGEAVERLAQAWSAPPDPIRAALILCADHELNVSSFTARCVASAGGTLYGAVAAGLAALLGVRHGGSTARVAAFLDEAQRLGDGSAAVAARRRRGEEIPGFGHPLYPSGDPRGEALLRYAKPEWASLIQSAAATIGEPANLDAGLVAIARSHGLPAHAPLTLFAIGRTVGLTAHAMEQYATGSLIRPRARYVGEKPT